MYVEFILMGFKYGFWIGEDECWFEHESLELLQNYASDLTLRVILICHKLTEFINNCQKGIGHKDLWIGVSKDTYIRSLRVQL